MSTMSDHYYNLFVSSDRNPLTRICTTLHWVEDLFLFKFYDKFAPLDKQTSLIYGITYLRGGSPSNRPPKVELAIFFNLITS